MTDAPLTLSIMAAILTPLSPHEMAGICTPDNGHNRPLNTVVFLCPPKTQTVLFRLLFIMAGYYRQTLKSLTDSVIGSANLFYPATRSFAPLIGGYSSFNGATA